MFTRYLFGQSNTESAGALPNSGCTGYYRGQSAVASWTHIFSPSLLQQVTVGFQRDYQVSSCLGCPRKPGTIASFGVQGLVGVGPSQEKFPQFNFIPSAARGVTGAFETYSSAGGGPYTPQYNPDMIEDYQDQVTWTHGRHTTLLRVDMAFWQSFHTQTAGIPSLTSQFTGASLSPDYKRPGVAEWSFGFESQLEQNTSLRSSIGRSISLPTGNSWNQTNSLEV